MAADNTKTEPSVMTLIFNQQGDFNAFDAARKWLSANGYSYGSLQAEAPVGIVRGDCIISKWRNLSNADIASLDGTLTGDMRNGPVMVTIKNHLQEDRHDQ